jgi:hypothetical protein
MSKVNKYRKEISSFTQEEDEKFSESWERLKDLLIKCPPHGYEKWRLVQFFYQRLSQPNRSMIESINGGKGAFLSLTGDLAYKALDKLSDSSQVWDFTSCRDKSARAPKKGGIYELKGETEINMKIDVLTKRLDALSTGPSINAAHTYIVDSCSICASPMHSATNCPSTPFYSEYPMEQVNAFNDYRKQSNGPYSKTYNPGWRNHPNFSWKQNQGGAHQNATNQYPPGFHTQQQNQPTSQVLASSYQSALKETMKTFIQSNGQLI